MVSAIMESAAIRQHVNNWCLADVSVQIYLFLPKLRFLKFTGRQVPITPTFDRSVVRGGEGGNITGRLVVRNLQNAGVTSGVLRYEITAEELEAISATEG